MSNAGTKRRQPVIGDAFDLETYGRPAGQQTAAARAKSPVVRRRRRVEPHVHERAPEPFATAATRTSIADREPKAVNDDYEERLAQGKDAVRTVRIRGQATPPRRRPIAQIARYDQHPDRAAQWALFLGVFMVVIAIVTGA